MLVHYSYRYGNKVSPELQCEYEDFKNFMKYLPKDVESIVLNIHENKNFRTYYIWQKPNFVQTKNGYYVKVGGWTKLNLKVYVDENERIPVNNTEKHLVPIK